VDEIGGPDLKSGWWKESMGNIEALWNLTGHKERSSMGSAPYF
jgi:hypothetical protein